MVLKDVLNARNISGRFHYFSVILSNVKSIKTFKEENKEEENGPTRKEKPEKQERLISYFFTLHGGSYCM